MLSLLKRFWHSETDSVTMAALVVGIASFASRLVGVLRDRILASTFGAGDVLDAYYAAFKIPDFLYNLVILGALSAAFIPVFTEYLEKNKKEAWRLAEQVLSIVGTVMLFASIVLYIFMPQLMSLIAPGFSGEKSALALQLSRTMLLSTSLLALSAVMGGVLQATRRFIAFSLAPVFYNIGIIFGILVLVPRFGPAGLGWGVVLGALFHFLVQASVAIRMGISSLPLPSFSSHGVRRIITLMIPRTMGLAIMQVNLVVILALASQLETGSVAVMNLAMNLQAVPIGIFGISFAVAAFPALSRAANSLNKENFREAFGGTARKIVFLVLPAATIMLLLRAQIVRLILGEGAFDWNDTIRTADALALFGISMIAQALVPLLSRAFYATQNTWTPLWIGIVSEGVNILLAVILVQYFGLYGLVIAFSVSAWISLLLFWWRLRASQGSLSTASVWQSFLRTIAACFIMAGAMLPVRIWLGTVFSLRTFWQVALQGGCSALIGIAVFCFASRIMRSKELEEFQRALLKKFWKKGSLLEGAEEAQGR